MTYYPVTMVLDFLNGKTVETAIDWPAWFSTAPQVRSAAFARTGVYTHKVFPSRFVTTSGHQFVLRPCRDRDAPGTVRYTESGEVLA
jgi:hypothetical protein